MTSGDERNLAERDRRDVYPIYPRKRRGGVGVSITDGINLGIGLVLAQLIIAAVVFVGGLLLFGGCGAFIAAVGGS